MNNHLNKIMTMKLSIFTMGGALLLATCLTAPAAEADKKSTSQAAKAASAKWLDELGEKGLVLDKVIDKGGFAVTHADSALGRVTVFTFQQPGWWVTFSFHGELTAKTPVKTLKAQFWHVCLNRLPTPGLKLPGWET